MPADEGSRSLATGKYGIAIVGTGQAGLQVAMSLRDEGYDGPVRLVGSEPGLPYQRPPLSKGYLAGALSESDVRLVTEAGLSSGDIDLVDDSAVESVERRERAITLAGGRSIQYDHLILACGSHNRRLPHDGSKAVFYLRTLADASAIKEGLSDSGRLTVVGAGFLGLEVAAVAVEAGKQVDIVEALGRSMSRTASLPLALAMEDVHSKKGVRSISGAASLRSRGREALDAQ